MKTDITIEKINKSHNLDIILSLDLEAVEDFYHLIKDKYTQKELIDIEKMHIENRGEYFTGLLNNEIVAICGYKILSETEVELRRFRVRKNLRSAGIGSKLLTYVEEIIINNGYKKITLETAILRPSTLSFYSNRNYINIGESSYGSIKTAKFTKELIIKNNKRKTMNIHHICIQTNNYNDSIDFYTKVLNFKILDESKNFNNREYNTWLGLNGFMIELQTGKKSKKLNEVDNNSEGIAHFCLYSSEFNEDFNRIKNIENVNFKLKKGNKIYNVGSNKLFKLIAPEGTVIEIRDSKSI